MQLGFHCPKETEPSVCIMHKKLEYCLMKGMKMNLNYQTDELRYCQIDKFALLPE